MLSVRNFSSEQLWEHPKLVASVENNPAYLVRSTEYSSTNNNDLSSNEELERVVMTFLTEVNVISTLTCYCCCKSNNNTWKNINNEKIKIIIRFRS